jgi:hypothetical protein
VFYKIFEFDSMSAVYGIENNIATFTIIPKDMKSALNEKKMQGF